MIKSELICGGYNGLSEPLDKFFKDSNISRNQIISISLAFDEGGVTSCFPYALVVYELE